MPYKADRPVGRGRPVPPSVGDTFVVPEAVGSALWPCITDLGSWKMLFLPTDSGFPRLLAGVFRD